MSHNTDTFRELQQNCIDLLRAHIKQYSHFYKVTTKTIVKTLLRIERSRTITLEQP